MSQVTRNLDGSWTAKGGGSLVVVSVTCVSRHRAITNLDCLLAGKKELADLRRKVDELQIDNRRKSACAEDLLERLVNVTEGSDDPVSDEEIAEIKATLGIAGGDD